MKKLGVVAVIFTIVLISIWIFIGGVEAESDWNPHISYECTYFPMVGGWSHNPSLPGYWPTPSAPAIAPCQREEPPGDDPGETPEPTDTPEMTPTVEITPTIEPTDVPDPTNTPEPTPTPDDDDDDDDCDDDD